MGTRYVFLKNRNTVNGTMTDRQEYIVVPESFAQMIAFLKGTNFCVEGSWCGVEIAILDERH